jgi:manganese-dependent inorganic pyrophosphatase
MNKVLIFGHRKPDTDSVCGAISLSYLKNKLGVNAEPRILSEINHETAYALRKFNIPVPKYLNDVKIQLKDIKYKKGFYINENTSIYETYTYMTNKVITGIPIVDDNKKFIGYVSLKEIASELIVSDSNSINTSFINLVKTLNSSKYLKFNDKIIGNVMAVTVPYRMFIDTIPLNENSIIIVGDREHIIDHALKSKVKLIIIISNRGLTETEEKLAKENRVNVITTPYDTFKTARIISLANPIKEIKRSSSAICFNPQDYLSDFLEVSNTQKHTNYPIVNNCGICEGMLRVIDTSEFARKKVILVDHNDPVQSVDGLDEAEILEIVDHHNIGSISTTSPINFRNMSVGSVNTIIYTLYKEMNIKIPREMAGIMLSGIVSDTLLLASPTTTEIDINAANDLAKIANLNLKEYGLSLLSSGVSIKGLTKEEIIYKDFKNYLAGDNKMGIGQVFTTSFSEYANELNDYVKELNEIAFNNDYKVVCLFVTDIIANNSYLIFNESSKEILEDAFNVDSLDEGELLKGFVSRKKQIVPLIMEILEKK